MPYGTLMTVFTMVTDPISSLPNPSGTGRYYNRIVVQRDCARLRQRSAIQRRAGGKRNGCLSHDGSFEYCEGPKGC